MHTISTFADKVILLDKGNAHHFENVADGVKAYNKLFWKLEDSGLEKVISGNEHITFLTNRSTGGFSILAILFAFH
jgi:ABC-type polysaccharide/polyol phosphate transport system ATPase subunit